MKAICLRDPADLASLVETDVPQPEPGAEEILVRVEAAGLTPTELLWYPTTHTAAGQPRTDVIPGHEFSGVVDGQEVFGMNDWFADGAMAWYCLSRPGWIAPKPANLTHVEAASVPIGALTAWQGLFEKAHLQPGETVLIHGGAGAVGVYAIQLASHHGARVVATSSAEHVEFLKQLGAGQVIEYRNSRFEDQLHDVDVVFDGVGGETLERSLSVLKLGGRLVTIATGSEGSRDKVVKNAFFIVEPNRGQLLEITRLLEAGDVKPILDKEISLGDAIAAYRGLFSSGNRRGKLVVNLDL